LKWEASHSVPDAAGTLHPCEFMKWLIVEDALRDRWGHWYEYLSTFKRGLRGIGVDVTFFCDRKAESFILSEFDARPVLPESIWHRMSDGAGPLRRYLRVPAHGLATFHVMWRHLRKRRAVSGRPGHDEVENATVSADLIFVPTVLVHHFLGWYLLMRSGCCPAHSRVLLFFPNLPLRMDRDGNAFWNRSPTTKLLVWLFRSIRPWVEQRKVILGVETEAMRQALAQLVGMPVVYLPHPVESTSPPAGGDGGQNIQRDSLLFACYGTARAEKGSDVLQNAILHLLASEADAPDGGGASGGPERCPQVRPCFAIQWIDDFADDDGRMVSVSEELKASGRVDYIRGYFSGQEYEERLKRTDAMILPYRENSYRVRVSRVVIEAMIHGMPVVATEGTTMWDQVRSFGSGLCFKEGNIVALSGAIQRLAEDFEAHAARAWAGAAKAREHFSVRNFRHLLINYIEAERLVLGDSHVARWNWATPGDAQTWSYGMAGATSESLLGMVRRSRLAPPASLLLWVGTNDILQDIAIETTAGRVKEILNRFPKATNAGRAGVIEVPPIGRQVEGSKERNRAISKLNRMLGTAARQCGARCIQCAAELSAPDGYLEETLTMDGIHLNDNGYRRMAGILTRHPGWSLGTPITDFHS
jgi:glycosyltransferase involved in cell wall biosynthesis/lysophospholipase L1-like esterase